jgi:hypothetical protein
MVRRKLRKEFPLFFSYTLFIVLSFLLRFGAFQRSPLEYFYVYWVTSALGLVFGFGVIYEIFQHVFRPYDALRDLSKVLFRWALLVLLLIAVVMAISNPQPAPTRIMQSILTLERSMRVTQCGMVLFLFLFSPFLGISWRQHLFGVALGFGLFGSTDLLLVTFAALGIPTTATMNLIRAGAYNFTILLWMWYMVRPEPVRGPVRSPIAERWNFALAGTHHGAGVVTAFHSLEDAVERVMVKSNGRHSGNGGGNGNGHQ